MGWAGGEGREDGILADLINPSLFPPGGNDGG